MLFVQLNMCAAAAAAVARQAGYTWLLQCSSEGGCPPGGPLGVGLRGRLAAGGFSCGCSCEQLIKEECAAATTPRAAAAEAAAAAANWETFVFSSCRGLEAAWIEAWRLFRLDAVKALASPRRVRV